MKIFVTTLFFLMSIASYSQSIYLGMRDNQYGHLGYIDKHHWFIIAEHSLFCAKIKQQSIRGYVGYENQICQIRYRGVGYGGIQYNNTYKSCGALIELIYTPIKWLSITGGIRPHYDTFYDYTTCYKAALDYHIYKGIGLFTAFSNYPEFRECDDRYYVGLSFRSKDLWIRPQISIPLQNKRETTRILISFGYNFDFSKSKGI